MASSDKSVRRCGICYRNLDKLHAKRTHELFDDMSVRCYAEPQRAHEYYISGFAFYEAPGTGRHDAQV